MLCRLDTQRAGSGYSIAPLVGLVTPPVALQPDGVEIVEAFEVPLGFLLDPGEPPSGEHGVARREALVQSF